MEDRAAGDHWVWAGETRHTGAEWAGRGQPRQRQPELQATKVGMPCDLEMLTHPYSDSTLWVHPNKVILTGKEKEKMVTASLTRNPTPSSE